MVRRTPFDEVQALVRERVGAEALGMVLPRRWELLGDVLILRFPGVRPNPTALAAVSGAYADVLRARIVLEDRGGVKGVLREPDVVRLFGEGPATTTVTQDGIRYRLDPERVMFSSGNLEERLRMARVQAKGETFVDLFAGIGYFTLPLLVSAGASHGIACELNPVSAAFLRENADANGVAGRLEVREGDCRDVAPRGVADRVLLGYFPEGHRFLATALAALKPAGGILHYHDTVKSGAEDAELRAHLGSALKGSGMRLAAATTRVVKSHSPGVSHAVIDAEVRP